MQQMRILLPLYPCLDGLIPIGLVMLTPSVPQRVTVLHWDQVLFSWSSKKQPTVALSSTEAEYRAACSGTCEVVWLRRLLGEIGFSQQSPSIVLCENQSCLAIARNPVFHARTKHIEVQYHFVREKILDSTIYLEHCSTTDNLADLYTKALPNALVVSHSIS